MEEIRQPMTAEAAVSGIEANMRGLMAGLRLLPGAEVVDRPEMLRFLTGAPFPLFNGVVGARLAAGGVDTAIDAALAPFRERGVPMLWWVGPSSEPADLGARLEARGLVHADASSGMAVDLAALTAPPALPGGLTIEPVRDAAALRDYTAALVAGFGLPPEAGEWTFDLCRRAGFGDAMPTNYLARLDGVPVATAMLALFGGVAGVWNVATVPGARRRGSARRSRGRPWPMRARGGIGSPC